MQDEQDKPPREMPWDRDMRTIIPIKIIVIFMTVIFIALGLATCVSLMTSPIR